jgi:hypothetical protein
VLGNHDPFLLAVLERRRGVEPPEPWRLRDQSELEALWLHRRGDWADLDAVDRDPGEVMVPAASQVNTMSSRLSRSDSTKPPGGDEVLPCPSSAAGILPPCPPTTARTSCMAVPTTVLTRAQRFRNATGNTPTVRDEQARSDRRSTCGLSDPRGCGVAVRC